jgi:hypothetical protein
MALRNLIVRKSGGKLPMFTLIGVSRPHLRIGLREFIDSSDGIYLAPFELASCSHACRSV